MTTPQHPQVEMPPPLLHLGGLLVGYGLDQVMPWSLPASAAWAPASGVMAISAFTLLVWTVLLFRRHRTTLMPHRAATHLVTGGPFRLSRNPIYLSFALLHLACALSQHSLGMLLTLPVVLYVMDRHVIAAEEAFHAQRFGAQWATYRARTRRWL